MRCYFNQSKNIDVGRSIFELDRINTYKVDLQELYELAEKKIKKVIINIHMRVNAMERIRLASSIDVKNNAKIGSFILFCL